MAIGWDDLIDDNVQVRLWVMKSMARRQAMGQHGALTPRSLREALLWVNDRVDMLKDRKRRQLGLPLAPTVLVDMGHRNDGFSREA